MSTGLAQRVRSTLLKLGSTNEDLPNLASKVVEGLSGDTCVVAMRMGREKMKTKGGVKDLVERTCSSIFPFAEAKELCQEARSLVVFLADNQVRA